MSPTTTDAILWTLPALLVAWLAYDVLVVAYLRPRHGVPTITARVQDLSRRYIAIPFLAGLILGLVCGHLFGDF